jgi:hypothetical protein
MNIAGTILLLLQQRLVKIMEVHSQLTQVPELHS